ncbi:MAG: hypothetical protein Kow0029_01740 [Candidatus Rifleibacteriota bacterium]
MNKRISLALLFVFSLLLPVLANSIQISEKVYDTENLNFIPHHGDGKFSNYLAMVVPYEPVKEVWQQLEKLTGLKLKNRGEAHITVVTPVEFWDLQSHISMQEIDKIALRNKIQQAKFKILGVGRGVKDNDETYFLVVQSPDLVNIRERILDRFIKNGGSPGKFIPARYFPHITVGFTNRDLHEADGVIKNKNSLVFPVKVVK